MLSAKTLLDKSWPELCEMDEFRRVMWEGLGEKGPWKHTVYDRMRYPQHCFRCLTEEAVGYEKFMATPCPVPPPITDPVEVVAKSLLSGLDENRWLLFVGYAWARWLRMKKSTAGRTPNSASWYKWCFQESDSTVCIIVCLLALNQIGE